MKKDAVTTAAIITLLASTFAIVGVLWYRSRKKKPSSSSASSNQPLNSILFVGDSITAGIGTSYSYLIKSAYPNKKIDILAKVGMKTDWMLSNLKAQLANNHYDRVYIWGGVNDIFSGSGATQALNNIQAIVDAINAQNGQAYVIIGYDAANFMTPSANRDNYIAFQNKEASQITGATIIPAFYIPSSATADNIHPNAAAHQNIAALLEQDIA